MGYDNKGKNNPMFGKKHNDGTKEKIRLKVLGRKVSEETKQKIANTLKGRIFTEEHKRKIGIKTRQRLKGKPISEEHKLKISLSGIGKRVGKDNPMWKGGITPYHRSIRTSSKYDKWRKEIKKRDGKICQMCCKRNINTEIHHIKKLSENTYLIFDINNGITLCKECHGLTKGKEEKYEFLFNFILESNKYCLDVS